VPGQPLIYIWFITDHRRWRIIHFNVTTNPSEQWAIQQLRESFPYDSGPRYLIYDNDSIFSDKVTEAIKYLGIEPKRTAYRGPWQNGRAKRWVGSARRELLDHRASGAFIIDTLGGMPHDERDSSRRSADDRAWMDF
jgi:transposase InsO family protein